MTGGCKSGSLVQLVKLMKKFPPDEKPCEWLVIPVLWLIEGIGKRRPNFSLMLGRASSCSAKENVY